MRNMATCTFKVWLCLLALFAILFLAYATSVNQTKQSSCNMVGDTVIAFNREQLKSSGKLRHGPQFALICSLQE